MESPGNDREIPQWLTEAYVEKILQKYLKDSQLKVQILDVKPATGKGDSYSSVINRVKVIYKVINENELRKISFLVKTNFEENEFLASILEKYDVCNTEMQMYEKVLPDIHNLLRLAGDDEQLAAQTIHVDYARKAIFLEDLAVKGYTMANRLQGLDEQHIKLSLKKLAKFHGATAVLNNRLKGSLEKYQHGIFNRHVNIYGKFFERVIQVCAEFCETCPELGNYYRDKLLKLIPHIVENVLKAYDIKEGHFITLNHGDFWTNNIMMQYDATGKKILDVLLIDLQYCNWTSPAVDLHYFFSTSLQDDLLFNHQDKLIQYYHEVLEKTLKRLNYKLHIPTLHELQIQLLDRGACAVASLLVNLPLLINDKTEDADFESLVSDSEKALRFRRVLYTNERVQRIVKVILPRFDRLGLLDGPELKVH